MAIITRAKFRLTAVQKHSYGTAEKFTFAPVYDPAIPEDQRFAKYTPAGELWISVDNPAVGFDLGRDYYLDFTPVPVDEPAPTA